jgi:mRNA interferase MazF
MAFQKGDVVLVQYAYTDLSSTKTRPAVVLSGDLYHREHPDLVLAALTTNILGATKKLDYVLKDWQSAGLRFESAFKPQLVTLEPTLVLLFIGKLSKADLHEIANRVR